MLLNSVLVTVAVLCPLISSAVPVEERHDPITIFKPPKVKPFLQIYPQVNIPVNSTDIFTTIAHVPNLGGNFTGVIGSGELVPIGAAKEFVAPESDGVKSFQTNTYTLNTTTGKIITLDYFATISYQNNALHGFASVVFHTGEPEFRYLNYGNYFAEFAAVFFPGIATVDIFELKSAGRRDGEPVLALLPPGGAPAP